MSTVISAISKSANSCGAGMGIGNAKSGTISNMLAMRLREIFPRKTWAYVCELLGVNERVGKHRMAGTREFAVDELAALLRSEHGFQFLVDVMADAAPAWWRLCRPLMTAADAQRMQVAARRKIKQALEQVLDADSKLTTTIERGQAALILQDEEFYGARLAPHGGPDGQNTSAYGVPRRAVAPTSKA